jgi:hypothetical protein
VVVSAIATGCGVSQSTGAHSNGDGGGYPVADPFWSDLPIAEFEPPMCDTGTWLPVHGLTPAMPVDYVALELTTSREDPDAGLMKPIDSTGAACATAPDKDSCQNMLRHSADGIALEESCGGPPYACQHFLVTTKGDTVRTYTPGPDLLSFLGTIDTPAEALLLVGRNTFHGYQVTCDDPTRASCGRLQTATRWSS